MVASRSASSRMIAADLPPSSSVTGRSSRPQVSAMARPAAVDPVNATLSTPGWATRYAPTVPAAGDDVEHARRQPRLGGRLSRKPMRRAAVSGDGLRTTGQPAASAGASLNAASACG